MIDISLFHSVNQNTHELMGVNYEIRRIVGEFVADIIVENLVILELKSARQIIKAHEVQLVNYLTATGKNVGLILNFGERAVEVKRKVRDLNDLHDQPDR